MPRDAPWQSIGRFKSELEKFCSRVQKSASCLLDERLSRVLAFCKPLGKAPFSVATVQSSLKGALLRNASLSVVSLHVHLSATP